MTKNTPRIFISLLLMLLCIGILPVSAFALYYGTCGIRNGRHTLLCALCGDCTAFLCSCLCIRLFG